MENEVEIRPAGIEDINTIGFLAQQIWPDAYANILSAEQLKYMLHLIYSPASLWEQMQQKHHRFLIAELNEEPVGFASYSQIDDSNVYKLHKLYVRTNIQGKGLGKALLEAVMEEISNIGATTLLLNVNRHNKAKNFYEKFGFKITGEEDIDIGSGYFMNDYVMERKM